jgi:uncharacterized protein (DUF58 family)
VTVGDSGVGLTEPPDSAGAGFTGAGAEKQRQPFPLVPRRRLVGLPFGDLPSRRRGHGSDVIGTRPYEIGDPVSTIDWFASARLSAATGSDEFIVRDHAADEAPRVVVVCDRRPAMGIYETSLPWLSKPRVIAEVTTALVTSATAARADVASLDFGDGDAYWLPPGRRDVPWFVQERQSTAAFDAPDDNLVQACVFLGRLHSDLRTGTFVFVVSDFLTPPPPEMWLDATARGWDVVPVIVQDPVWEQSFPDVGGVAVPIRDPSSGRVGLVRLSRGEARALRSRNQSRLARLREELVSLDLEPVVLGTSDPFDIDRAFVEWAELRRLSRWAR